MPASLQINEVLVFTHYINYIMFSKESGDCFISRKGGGVSLEAGFYLYWRLEPQTHGSGHGGGAELAQSTICLWEGLEVNKKRDEGEMGSRVRRCGGGGGQGAVLCNHDNQLCH